MRMSSLNKKKLLQDIKEMTETIKEYGNPLIEESRELVSLDNNMVSHTETLDPFEFIVIEQFQNFQRECEQPSILFTYQKE